MASQDITKRLVQIDLDKERNLYYGNRAFLYLTDKYENLNDVITIITTQNQAINKSMITALLDLVYAGLIFEDRNLKLDDMIDWFDFADLGTVIEKVAQAWRLAMPEAKENPTLSA